jgi:hypothetical protein
VYPETTFTGRYAFHGESPCDPHPGSKKGYEVHLSASEGRGGLPLYELPQDVSKTFAHQLALNSIEELLEFQHLSVREGVKVMNLQAVADLAADVARVRDAGGNYRRWLDDWAHRYRMEIRAWISGGPTDPRLAELLDSFVHRADKKQAELLHKTLDRAQVPEAARQSIWAAYEQCGSDGDKKVFVENVLNSTRASGGCDGRREGKRPGGRLDGPRRDDREL